MEINFDLSEVYLLAKGVITDPKGFFKSKLYKKQKGIKDSFVYYAILNLWLVVGSYLVAETSGKPGLLSVAVISYLSALIILFVVVFLLHMLIKIFGGKSEYKKTFRLFVFSGTPSYVFGFIPVVNFLAGLYGIYLLVLGTMSVYSFSMRKAVLMYLAGIIFSIAITGLAGVVVI